MPRTAHMSVLTHSSPLPLLTRPNHFVDSYIICQPLFVLLSICYQVPPQDLPIKLIITKAKFNFINVVREQGDCGEGGGGTPKPPFPRVCLLGVPADDMRVTENHTQVHNFYIFNTQDQKSWYQKEARISESCSDAPISK